MKTEQMTEALEKAAAELGIEVRYETLSAGGVQSGGGLCKVRGRWWVIIEKKASAAERLAILTDALSGMDLGAVSLPGKVRDLVEQRRATKQPPKPPSTPPPEGTA